VPTPAEALVQSLEAEGKWPPEREKRVWRDVTFWCALRDSDRRILAERQKAAAEHYKIDPLPEKIAEAFSDLVWPEDPTFTATAEGDQEALDELVAENQLGSRLKEATDQQVSEGSTWWRIFSDPDMAEAPLLDFHSRLDVLPLFVGGTLRAVAFWSRLDGTRANVHARHFEIHEDGRVHNLLYVGTPRTLGKPAALDSHEETAGLREVWDHGLRMLAGWVPNRTRRGVKEGVSEFDPIQDFLLELNESLETGSKNRSLTARKRVVVPQSALGPDGTFDPDIEAIVDEQVDTGDVGGAGGANRFRVLEYSFDAQALIDYQNDIALRALTRVGIAAQFIGVPTPDGSAESGTAMRLRLIPSTNAARGKAKPWDDNLPTIISRMMEVANLPREAGGFAASFTVDEPAIERGHPLSEDPVERSGRLATLKTAGLVSVEQAVREQHPEWDDDQVDEEVGRIKSDAKAEQPSFDSPPNTGQGNGVPSLFAGSAPSDRSAQNASSDLEGDGV
jgi:hypothetical protein